MPKKGGKMISLFKLNRMVAFVLFTICLAISGMHSAMAVEIGGGTSGTSYVPVYGFYDYSWTRCVYLQSELGNAMTINKIAYQLFNSPSNYRMPNQQIWIKHTSDSSITNSSYLNPSANGFTKVFDGQLTFTGTQGDWFEIGFNVEDFDYNGSDNLIVIWENRDGDYASGYPRWYYNSVANRSVYKYADGSFPYSSGNVSSYLPNTRFFSNIQPCTFTIDSFDEKFEHTGGQTFITINASAPNCDWTIGEDLDWVKVSSISGQGDGAVTLTVDSNDGFKREGDITIAGKTFTIKQSSNLDLSDDECITMEDFEIFARGFKANFGQPAINCPEYDIDGDGIISYGDFTSYYYSYINFADRCKP